MKRRIIALMLLVVSGTLLAGCPQRTQDPTTTTAPTAATTTTTVKKVSVKLYFVEEQDGVLFLVPENRDIPESRSLPQAVVRELVKGADQAGRRTLIPAQAKVLSVRVADKVATVDFSKEVLSANVGAAGEEAGIAQVVNTLTELPEIERVRFLVEGRAEGLIDGREIRDWWGHVGLYEQPFNRRQNLIRGAVTQERTIIVDEPGAFTEVDNPLIVKGKAQVFEAQFQVRILDKDGGVLADVPVLADDFNWGDFEEQIGYKRPKEPGHGTVLFYFHSPQDGSEVTMGRVTVFMK